ncbi:MAG: hypothetical protein ACOCWC_01435 [Bacteroidota bacterium]
MRQLLIAAFISLFSLCASSQNISSGMISLDCTMDVTLSKGFTHSKVFLLNGEKFFFSHNSNNGETRIWNLEKGGNPVFSKKWSSGWTNINFYEYKGKVYFFHQKGETGLARINKLNYNDIMNGKKMGEKVFEANWSKGWTNTLFFVKNDILYFLHYKSGTGLARLNASKDGSSVGTKIYEKTWSKGYSNFAMTDKGNNFYILYQKGNEGTCVINKIDLAKLEAAANAGLMSPNLGSESYRKKWSSGWDNLIFFKLDGETYLFLNKPSTGKVHIEKLKDDGTLGPRFFEKTWSKGWTGIDIFYRNGKPQLMHQKKSTGQTKICELKF